MCMKMSLHEFISVFLLASAAIRTSSSQQYEFMKTPGVVRADVNQSAALEWMLNMEPKEYHFSVFRFEGKPIFKYETATNRPHPPNIIYPRTSVYETDNIWTGFRLEGLRQKDAGNYMCVMEGLNNEEDSAKGDAILFIYDIPSQPKVDVSPEDIVMNTTLNMDCESTSTSLPEDYRPAMLYTWSRNGDVIDMASLPERHAVTGDSGETLKISPVHRTDHQATYTCTASENGTQLSSPVADNVILEVLYGPVTLATNPRNPSAVENSTLVITATADCNPNCSFSWRNGSDVIGDSAVLEFQHIQLDDAGIYTVKAGNKLWYMNLNVEVTVVPEEIPTKTSTEVPEASKSPGDNTTYHSSEPSSAPQESQGGSNMAIIIAVSVVAGVIVIVIVVVVVVMAMRRNKNKNTGSGRTGDGTIMEEIAPYISVSANLNGSQEPNHSQGPNGARATPDVVESVVYDQAGKKNKWKMGRKGNKAKEKEETGASDAPPPLYAQVNKPKKKDKDKSAAGGDTAGDAVPTALYAQVNKPKKNLKSDGTTKGDQPVSPEVPPPPAVYAQVMKKKKKKKGLSEVEGGSIDTEAGVDNSAFFSPCGDCAYEDVRDRHPLVPGQEECTYYNTAPMRRVPEAPNGDPIMSPGGVTYADLAFVNDGRAVSRVVHQKEAPTEYASIALTRRTSSKAS